MRRLPLMIAALVALVGVVAWTPAQTATAQDLATTIDVAGLLQDLAPTPAARCEGACQTRAKQAVRQCVANGGSAERCGTQGRKAYQDCVTECERRAKCGETCKAQATRLLRACLAQGGTAERCERRAREAYRVCTAKCGQPTRCTEACKTTAQQALRQCLAGGGAKERCENRSRTVYSECLKTCGSVSPRPNP